MHFKLLCYDVVGNPISPSQVKTIIFTSFRAANITAKGALSLPLQSSCVLFVMSVERINAICCADGLRWFSPLFMISHTNHENFTKKNMCVLVCVCVLYYITHITFQPGLAYNKANHNPFNPLIYYCWSTYLGPLLNKLSLCPSTTSTQYPIHSSLFVRVSVYAFFMLHTQHRPTNMHVCSLIKGLCSARKL